jgi:PhzF family phenazine biosynthesis protein
MPRVLPFKQVDVFTERPLFGNPVAVVFDADGLSDEELLKVANWTNLSETTFFQSPSEGSGADYRLRIFHPQGELAFAGHPTVGSAHAWLESGLARLDPNVLRMECGAGVLTVRPAGEGSEMLIFTESPAAEFVHEFGTSVEAISAALGASIVTDPAPASIYNGPTWLFVQVDDAALTSMKPDMGAITRLSGDFSLTGIAAFALREEGETRVHIRCFGPIAGVPEDPVTGSANAALPTYLERTGLLARVGREYTSTQGTELGRDGRVYVRTDGVRTEIGGQAVTVIDGEIRL